MIVTKTEAVTKTKYKVYIDEQFAFVLYKGELSRYRLEEGCEVPEAVYEEICQKVLLKRAKLRAMYLLNEMGRTESQLRTKLKQGGYPADVIDEALHYVKSFGYVNDLNYAKNFVESRKDRKSRKEIYVLLCGKGISGQEIEQALEECYGEDAQTEAIQKLMRKRHFDPVTATYEDRQKFMAYLMRRGFSYDDVRRVTDA